jgi:hypothetical protein
MSEDPEAITVRLVDPADREVVLSDGTVPVTIVGASPRVIPVCAGITTNMTTAPVDRGMYRGPCGLVVDSTAGTTVLMDIQGSVDRIHFYNLAYALVATPATLTVAQITITTTTVVTYQLLTDQAWRYLRLVFASINGMVITATLYI